MGTTIPNAFPYPNGGDPIQGGDDVIKALAEAIEAKIMPSAWTAITPLSAGFTARAGYYAPAYRVYPDGRVQLRGALDKSTNLASGNTPFTVDVPARPSVAVSVPFAHSRLDTTRSVAGRIDISTLGVFTIQVIDAGATTWMSLDGVTYSK
jgi:hypothetical protein